MNDGNLIPFGQRTESEQRELARRGGIASGAARRERKRIRELVADMLERTAPSGMTYAEQIAVGLVKDAVGGDLRAVKMVLDLDVPEPVTNGSTMVEVSPAIKSLLESIQDAKTLQIQ